MGERRKASILVLLVLLSSSVIVLVNAQPSWVEWSQTYGGDGKDYCTSMVQTADGGFVLFGIAQSFETPSAWLVKTDEYGNMEWNKTIGGGTSFIQTLDGGFAFVGTNASSIDGYIPVGYLPDGFWSHVWLAKTDANGNIEWTQTYDEEIGCYQGTSLVQTTDGGYALVGNSFSSFGDYDDFLLIKTDSYGNREWSELYDYSEHESGSGLVQTFDGGFVLMSKTYSFGEMPDFWFIKTDELGNMEWKWTYGDSRMVSVTSFIQLSEGGFVFAGSTKTLGDGGRDFFITKIDNIRNIEWTQTYETENNEQNPSLVQTSDGGFALAGYSHISNEPYLTDFLLIKTDNQGNMLGNQTYPAQAVMGYPSLVQTLDGGFALSGAIGSLERVDYDFLLIKTDAYGIPEFPSWIILPLFITSTLSVIIIRHKIRKKGLE
ncbi:hypothetical protein ACFLRN_05745 [Thermoproteota archaeon]